MSKIIKANILGQDVELEDTKPLTLLYGSELSHYNNKYEGFFPIDIDITTYHAERVVNLHEEFDEYFKIVFPDVDLNKEEISSMGTGLKHVIGLVDMLLKFQDTRTRVVLKYPESGLHPKAQLQLADLFIALIGRAEKLDA